MRFPQTATLVSLVLLSTVLALTGGTATSRASSIQLAVNSTEDAPDVAAGNGVCETASGNGVCTLRAAIQEGNATTGAVTINVPGDIYTLSQGELFISGAVTINGAGADSTTIDGAGQSRVFFISQTAIAAISGVTITGGDTGENGGGILNVGALSLNTSVIRNNSANTGGGIASGSDGANLVIDRTTIRENDADVGGGGIFLADEGSQATITNTTISYNTGNVYTGGIHTQSDAIVSLSNVTVSGNTSPPPTFTITSGADVTLTNVTVADNNAPDGNSGAIAVYGTGHLTMKNSIFQDDFTACFGDGTFNSLGHNIDGDGSCHLIASGDMPSTDPLLGPVADNGGPTETRALLPGSPAIDGGDNDGCPATDQRGISRPADGDGDTTAVCDIGAFELAAPPVLRQGDVNCDGAVNQSDFDFILRYAAGLNDGSSPGDCPNLEDITVALVQVFGWGDVNCDSVVDAIDALFVLAHTADVDLEPVSPTCTSIGQPFP